MSSEKTCRACIRKNKEKKKKKNSRRKRRKRSRRKKIRRNISIRSTEENLQVSESLGVRCNRNRGKRIQFEFG